VIVGKGRRLNNGNGAYRYPIKVLLTKGPVNSGLSRLAEGICRQRYSTVQYGVPR